MGRFFNGGKMLNTIINANPQISQAVNSPIQFILAEIKKGNPEMMSKVFAIWNSPLETLNKFYANNPQMQQQFNASLGGKSIEEQRQMIVVELENSGINIKEIARNFGIKL